MTTITRRILVEKLLDYLNHRIPLAALVDWAEFAMIDTRFDPEADTARLMDVLSYVAAGDTPDFPLTWDILSDFLDKLGAPVRVELASR